jgi:pyrroline-5-carboxylate reductase
MSDTEVIGVRDIFMLSGKALVLPEKHMDAVTALSGSGPGFLAHILYLMIEAGRELGLPEREALELGVQTFVGTARLLDEGTPPERLVEMVRSPGGTTEAGLKTFEERGLAETVRAALLSARDRGRELAM